MAQGFQVVFEVDFRPVQQLVGGIRLNFQGVGDVGHTGVVMGPQVQGQALARMQLHHGVMNLIGAFMIYA